jgi:hypothetical protein
MARNITVVSGSFTIKHNTDDLRERHEARKLSVSVEDKVLDVCALLRARGYKQINIKLPVLEGMVKMNPQYSADQQAIIYAASFPKGF